MKQALNATFFGIGLSTGNNTLMTIFGVAEAVVCALFVVLAIYILCEKKKRAAAEQKEMIKLAKKEAATQREGGKATETSAGWVTTEIGSDGIITRFGADGKSMTEMGAGGITTKLGSDSITTRIGADGQITNSYMNEKGIYPTSSAQTGR